MYKEFSEELKGITPTFTAVLNHQIAKIMDSFSIGDYDKAYQDLKTLINALREEDSEELLTNDIVHIEKRLKEAGKPRSAGFYRGLTQTSASQESVLASETPLLFRQVMRILHKGGYLEKRKKVSKGRFEG